MFFTPINTHTEKYKYLNVEEFHRNISDLSRKTKNSRIETTTHTSYTASLLPKVTTSSSPTGAAPALPFAVELLILFINIKFMAPKATDTTAKNNAIPPVKFELSSSPPSFAAFIDDVEDVVIPADAKFIESLFSLIIFCTMIACCSR